MVIKWVERGYDRENHVILASMLEAVAVCAEEHGPGSQGSVLDYWLLLSCGPV
jgi:hypothetical protein